jgi:flagellar protein FliO/FliZ
MNDFDSQPPDFDTVNVAGSLIWVIVALLIVIGLIVVSIRFLAGRSRIWGANRSLRTLGGVALGQNKSMQVVDIGGRIYVVGVGEDITLLDKIDDPVQVEAVLRMLEQPSEPMWDSSSIGSMLKRMRGARQARQSDPAEWDSASFQSVLQRNLNRQAESKQKVESILQESHHKDRLMDE